MLNGIRAGKRRSFRNFLLFIIPAFLLYTIFVIYPMFTSFYYSFTDWGGVGNAAFVGFSNYIRLFTDPEIYPIFYRALWHNLYIFIATILIQTPLSLYFAYVLNLKVKGHSLYRNVIFFPVLMSTVSVSLLSLIIFEPNIGTINTVLHYLHLDDWMQPWLGLENLVLFIIILIGIWKSIGISTMLYLANIQSIPKECLEAASVEGATEFTLFRKIIFPLLAPSFTINVILTFIGSIGAFEIVYAIAGISGSPNFSADVLGTFFYRFAFTLPFGNGVAQLGFATAIAVIIFIITLVVSVIQLIILRKREIEA